MKMENREKLLKWILSEICLSEWKELLWKPWNEKIVDNNKSIYSLNIEWWKQR